MKSGKRKAQGSSENLEIGDASCHAIDIEYIVKMPLSKLIIYPSVNQSTNDHDEVPGH